MNSPFSGMDPYLERYWSDVHLTLSAESRNQLNSRLPPGLIARCESRLIVQDWEGPYRSIRPDLVVTEYPEAPVWDAAADEGGMAVEAAVAAPIVVRVSSEEEVQHFIEIIDPRDGDRVVTCIEFISRSNKLPGDGLEKYLKKQGECHEASVNLVEIDLTRAAGRENVLKMKSLLVRHHATYMASVWRATQRDQYEFYMLPLRERLRSIRIPLRPTDADVVLDLQPLIDLAYRNGAYARIDYSQPAEPPLSAEDAAWAAERRDAAKPKSV